MTINNIYIKNFRAIPETKIVLDGKSVVFFGINGSGKSSVLQAINFLFSRIITRIVQNRFKQNIKIADTDVRYGTSRCEIDVDFTFNGQRYSYGRIFDKKSNRRLMVRMKELELFAHDYMKIFESIYDETLEQISNIPIYVNYGVNRLVIDVPLRIRKTHVFDPLYAYENAIQSTVDFRTFFEWFRNREDYENEVRSRDNPQYIDNQLQAVRNATEIMLTGFKDLCVQRNPLRMKIRKDVVFFDVKQLSDGEKCVLALIGDLARRASMANPTANNPLETEGIVIIDEIELHLHPTWQRRIVGTLRDIFPNIQFIISTHSPQVLGDIPDDMKVFELSNDMSIFTISEMKTLRGWDVNSILENNMNTSSQNLEFRGRISHAYALVQTGEYALAESIVDDMENMTSNKNADVVKLRFLISREKKK